MRVLLVDDETKFVNMLAKRLKLRGFEIDVATSGNDAMTLAKTACYDVAVLDIKMPGISGIQLKHRLAETCSEMKYIFVTGHGAIDKTEKERHPDDIYLSKPLNIDALIETITQITSAG